MSFQGKKLKLLTTYHITINRMEVIRNLPEELIDYIIILSLDPNTFYKMSLINNKYQKRAADLRKTVFYFDHSNIKKGIDQKVILGPIKISTETPDPYCDTLIISFPNGKLTWTWVAASIFELDEFIYDSLETNCKFLEKIFAITEDVLDFVPMKPKDFCYYCECDDCRKLNAGRRELLPTPRILDIKPIDVNNYSVTFDAGPISNAMGGIKNMIATYNPETGSWKFQIMAIGGRLGYVCYNGQPFYGNFQAILNDRISKLNKSYEPK